LHDSHLQLVVAPSPLHSAVLLLKAPSLRHAELRASLSGVGKYVLVHDAFESVYASFWSPS